MSVLEDRVRTLENQSHETAILIKTWIDDTKEYRGHRESVDKSIFNKLDELKTGILQLPCVERMIRSNMITTQIAWIWGILGVGGTALVYAFVAHLFGKGG